MKTQSAHAYEDRLLDFAYEELPESEAHQVKQHVQDCSRCAAALRDIRGVRGSMSRLPKVSAPDAGLESLLAYAQQSARRSSMGAEPAQRWWRRLLAPALSAAALGVVGIVTVQMSQEASPVSPAASKQSSQEASSRRAKAESVPAAAPAPAPVVSAPAAQVSAEVSERHTRLDNRIREEQRAAPMGKALPSKSARLFEAEDMGSGGGFPAKKRSADFGQVKRQPAPRAVHEEEASRDDAYAAAGVMAEAPPPLPAATAPAAPLEQKAKEALAEPVSKPQAARSAGAASVSPRDLLRQADGAARAGDREQEIVYLRRAVAAGEQDVAVLSRLCQAEAALGHRRNAIESCSRVLGVAPGSSEALKAQRLLDEDLRPADSEAR
ncbi:hypothetical protein [Melittangium boletus]|uniref:Putative zinc-finger domain-containing protein n=1 Tax=Melittangium boletus DSM 14713 TaxID=1294270 RepID=A0A250ITN9_9BACT|nr:hypothetical protein [Melittangium boletus]ATB34521.1 hypothetical protein MEBOL_008026 [Melittangium boletus DSM 14713]